MTRIQVVVIVLSFLFLVYTSRLIIRGRLREEYVLVWWIFTGIMVLFSVWPAGLEMISDFLQIQVPTNLVFAGFIFVILVYLLHLSLVNSKLQKSVTRLTQELALLKEKTENPGTGKK